jgi:F-type H+-transporting ATPase subunit a
MLLFSPFEQFRLLYILKYADHYISTALLEVCLLLVLLLGIYMLLSMYRKNNFIFYIFGELYSFVYGNLRNYVGNYTNFYFPFFFYLFLFILICNLVGLLPYSITLTSQLFVTLSLAMVSWFGTFYIGLSRWGLKMFSLFFPHGVSIALVFFLVIIETISYVFRIFSLALRLFANIVAGHILIDCIVYFIYKIIYTGTFFTSFNIINIIKILIPFIFLLVLFFFELVVAFLQAYIFIILSSLYLKEIL